MRPRLCRQCHARATHVEIQARPTVTIYMDGTVERDVENVSVYWCDQHSGIAN